MEVFREENRINTYRKRLESPSLCGDLCPGVSVVRDVVQDNAQHC